MDKDKIQELCIRTADRIKEALEKGNNEEALQLIPALEREDRARHKSLARVIVTFLVSWIQDKFLEDQKNLAGQIRKAIEEGDKKRALAIIEARTDKWVKIHDIYIDFMADCFGYIYDSFGQEALFEFYRKWGEGTREWFEKRARISRDELVELGCRQWREHVGNIRIEEEKDRTRIIQQPCGAGGRRLEREKEGVAGRKGISDRIREEFPLCIGARSNIPMYCTHCVFLFETLCKEYTGRPLWAMSLPDKAGDPCILEIYDKEND